jgi:three-Cys-motif partner protein
MLPKMAEEGYSPGAVEFHVSRAANLSHARATMHARGKTMGQLKIDEVGAWSEIKIEIIRKYAKAFSTILDKQEGLRHIYVDGFAGAGYHISRTSGEQIKGSPQEVLDLEPRFDAYHLIDIEESRIESLKEISRDHPGVSLYKGDCNRVLLDEIFPQIDRNTKLRAFVLLDPYKVNLDWRVVEAAGRMKRIDLMLHFPVADMNRNVFWRNPEGVDPDDIKRMNRFWGDESWRSVAYSTEENLFGMPERTDNETIALAYADRLVSKAGFHCSAQPLAMKNSKNADIYYLQFASPKPVGCKIANDIFKKYRKGGHRG